MITVIGGIKGGGGKTTIATNLCVMRSDQGKRVLLVDADEQRSASDWAAQRHSKGIANHWVTIQLSGRSIHTELSKMKRNYDDIIIDVGGRDTTSQRSALSIANICLIPFKPKSFDMWTLGAVKEMISEAVIYNSKLKSYAIINQAEPRGKDCEEAIEVIEECEEFTCIPHTLGYRKSFASAAAEGLGVIELPKADIKSVHEIKLLYTYIFDILYANILQV